MTSSDSYVLVAPNTLGPSAYAQTRVMSPTSANSGVLLGLECVCQFCDKWAAEPTQCVNCGTYGHAICINAQMFRNYSFCGFCVQHAVQRYEALGDTVRQQEWQDSLSTQLVSWQQRAREAVGVSASVGQAIGGAAATAAGAVVAAAQGLARGAASASQGQPALQDQPVPPPPLPDLTLTRRPATLRKSTSTGDLGSVEICRKCFYGDKKACHTYRGTCKGIPWSVWSSGPGGNMSIAKAPGFPRDTTLPQVPSTRPPSMEQLADRKSVV